MTIRRVAQTLFSAAAVGIAAVELRAQEYPSAATAIMPATPLDNQYAIQHPGQPANPPASEMSSTESPFRYGPFILQPDFSYQISYETGIQAAPGVAADVTNQTFTGALVLQAGTVWNLSYTPSWVRYSSSLFRDAFDQTADLGASFPVQSWNLQFTQSFSRTSDPLIETGRQTQQSAYGTQAKGFYGAGGSQISFEVDLDQEIRFAALSPSVYDWENQYWLHYQPAQQWDFAVGVGGGFTHDQPGFDMVDAKPEGKIAWHPTNKLSVDIEGGVEASEYFDNGDERSRTPIYSANVNYAPWLTTTLIAGASRQLSASYIADQESEGTSFNVQLQQRLLEHYYLSCQASTSRTNYLSTASDLANVRGDTTDSLEVSLRTQILKRLSLGINAGRQRNSSSVQGYGFTSGQYGFSIDLKY